MILRQAAQSSTVAVGGCGAIVNMAGTPYYMAPECINNQPYDFKADVWSLGCVLYEMMAFKSPFYADGDNLYRLAKKIIRGNFPAAPAIYSSAVRRSIPTTDLSSKSADSVNLLFWQLRNLVGILVKPTANDRPTASEANLLIQEQCRSLGYTSVDV